MVSDIIDTVAPVSASIGNRRIIYLHMYLDWKLTAFLTITKGLDELQESSESASSPTAKLYMNWVSWVGS